jgi:membrane-bound lytic murein transglycosylase D
MKNVTILVKLRRLVKSLAVSLVLLFFVFAGSAFKSETDGVKKSHVSDSTLNDKSGFKSLFSNSRFDPTKPYVTQINPNAVSFVQNYIRAEGENLEKMKIWGKPYFDMYDGILAQYGLPKELKYLSVIESSLVPGVVSPAGAVGPWQIMASEAIRMGLKVNGRKDERKNVMKSTHAAAKILKGLHSQFEDWLLVIAAYNCGEGRVRQAIRKSGSRNFWELQSFLPAETRGHVKRFIGTHYIFEGSGGLTTMTASEILDHDLNKVVADGKRSVSTNDPHFGSVEISGKYKASIVAKVVGIDFSSFSKLNPNFDKLIGMGQNYNLTLPVEKMIVFGNNKNTILNESIKAYLN